MARRLAEISIGKIGIDGIQVCSVKEVEELKAELEVHRLSHLRILQERYIPLFEPRFTAPVSHFESVDLSVCRMRANWSPLISRYLRR